MTDTPAAPAARAGPPVLMKLAAAAWMAAVLGACSSPAASPSHEAADRLVAPRHDLTGADGLPAGDLVATLEIRNGCLVVVAVDGRVDLALWPPDARIESVDGVVTVLDAGAPAGIGRQIHVGGGEYGPEHRDFVEELIGERIHPACAVDGYWLVSEVLAD